MKLRKISIVAVSFASLAAFAGQEDLYFGAVKHDRWIFTQSELVSEKPVTGDASRGAILKGKLEMEIQISHRRVVLEDRDFLDSDRFHYVESSPMLLRFSDADQRSIQRMVPPRTSAIFFTNGRTNITRHRLVKFGLTVIGKGRWNFYWSEELGPEYLYLQAKEDGPPAVYLSDEVKKVLAGSIRKMAISALHVTAKLDLYGSDSSTSRLSIDLESAEVQSLLGLKLNPLERLKQACDKILSPPSR